MTCTELEDVNILCQQSFKATSYDQSQTLHTYKITWLRVNTGYGNAWILVKASRLTSIFWFIQCARGNQLKISVNKSAIWDVYLHSLRKEIIQNNDFITSDCNHIHVYVICQWFLWMKLQVIVCISFLILHVTICPGNCVITRNCMS